MTTQTKTDTKPQDSRKGRSQAPIVNDSDEESDGMRLPDKPTLRAGRSTKGRTRIKPGNATDPLFLDSGDEKAREPDDSEEDLSTMKSSAGSQKHSKEVPKPPSRTRAKKAPAVLMDDDSDDGAVFKGFKGKKKGR